MPRILFAALTLALGFVALAGAQERTKPNGRRQGKIEQAILQIERETMAAIKNKDAVALSRLLADDFVYRTPAGPDLARIEFLNLVKAVPVKILDVRGDNLKVHVFGRTAVLTGVQRSQTQGSGGEIETSAQAFTDIFVRRDGRWLLVLAYGVDLPTAQ